MEPTPSSAARKYDPAWWLPGPHAQTIWGRMARRTPLPRLGTEIVRTPDGDWLELHTMAGGTKAPRVLMLHGLEGSIRSHYVRGMLSQATIRGWGATVVIFRGCGSAPNEARRFYHSGETSDVAFAFELMRSRAPESRWCAVGVSLGGNVMLKWLAEASVPESTLAAAAAVSVPFDLQEGARKIARGIARIYDRGFVRSLCRKARLKLERYPDLIEPGVLDRVRTIEDFDEAVTAPVHGFASARDYYEQSSSIRFLSGIRVPTLLLSSYDDPFLPAAVLNRVKSLAAENSALTTEFHAAGGHVGFVGGSRPWHPFYYADWRVFRFFDAAVGRHAV